MTDENTSPTQDETREPSSPTQGEGGGDDDAPEKGSPDDKAARPEAKESALANAAARPPGPSLVFLAAVSIGSLAADLGTKLWAKATLDDGTPFGGKRVEIIEGVFGFIFAKNRGGAWGLLQDESEAVRRPFFLLISAAAIFFIVTLYRRVTPEQTALKWGLPLVLGGAIGNLVDRIRYGYVVDFIDVHVTKTFRWPTFNVADIAICVGVGLMAIDMFTSRKPAKTGAPEGSGDKAPLSPPADGG